MSSIEQYRASVGHGGVSRQVGRTLARIDGGTNIDLAVVDARAQVQATKVDAMAAVTQRALQGAAYITNIEMALAEACPAAMSRLKLIGDTGSMALGGIVMDTASKLGRI